MILLNFFKSQFKRVINLLKALSTLRNTFLSQNSRFALDFLYAFLKLSDK